MQSVLARQPTLPGASGSSHPIPRKSSSFLSLKREKTKSPPSLDISNPSHEPSGSRPTYFDAYPRPLSTANSRSSKHKHKRDTHSSPRTPDEKTPTSYRNGLRVHTSDPLVAFPTVDSADEDADSSGDISATPVYSRNRSKTGPSRRSSPWNDSSIPALRFSGSSTQHTETPPDTPVDSTPFREFTVVVAAPVSGVETMDALVDGMNGGGRVGDSLSRARFGIPGHHPLYQPPLPTPPPGVVLGGGKARKPKPSPRSSVSRSSYSGDEDEVSLQTPVSTRTRRRRFRRSPTRITTNAAATSPVASPPHTPNEEDKFLYASLAEETPRRHAIYSPSERKSVAPSISDIIRNHAPPEAQFRSRPSPSVLSRSSSFARSNSHATVREESEPEPEPLTLEDEAEMVSRSSIDSVADEVQRTLRNQGILKPTPTPPPPSAFPRRHSTISDNFSIASPRSDAGAGSSVYASSIMSGHRAPSPLDPTLLTMAKPLPSQAVAQYLRSARLTTLLKLTRSPHASQDNPLTVSLSDLGSPTGFPVVVFLGLGCVRHIMGLYDEMAQILGLRLITIDRWGLGRTEPRSKSAKGIMQWAGVVEEVLDLLHIEECSVMAHSAGTPYALSFANKLPSRIRGDICLLAPWVGGSENGGYKWLKYVPNGILKTAQAAEWKVQAWMIGKPPTIAYEGIGYNAVTPPKSPRLPSPPRMSGQTLNVVYPSSTEVRPRPSMASSNFSEYDDLGDFDGRFESRSTLGVAARTCQPGSETKLYMTKRKDSRGFLERLKGVPVTQPPSPTEDKTSPAHTGKRLKALRSMGSLRSKSSSQTKKLDPATSPQLPPTPKFEAGLGFDDLNWAKAIGSDISLAGGSTESTSDKFSATRHTPSRQGGRRSLSFTAPTSWSPVSAPTSPAPSTYNATFGTSSTFTTSSASNSTSGPNTGSGSAYQSQLGNALIAASHAESAKGTHNDLLQILNHDNHPWGFSYTAYPHNVYVWYGDKDEKIAENAVRWMEKNMGEDRCTVKVVKGADHALMFKSSVVVEVLERVLGYW